MSKRAKAWASRQNIASPSMKAVLGVLAYMHRDGSDLFPSQAYIARETGLTDRAVRSALQLLAHFEVVAKRHRSAGARGRTSDIFVLALGSEFTLAKPVIVSARKALRKPSSNRKSVPVVANSLPEPSSSPTGTAFRGIGDYQDTLSHEGNSEGRSVGQYTREGADQSGPALRLIAGGAK